MSKKRKDTDYLCLSAQIRSKERNLLDHARMERMIEAPTVDEAVRLLTELGYEKFDSTNQKEFIHSMLQRRVELFDDLVRYTPEPEIVDVFRLKYDYHNLKTIIKTREEDNSNLLIDAGRVPIGELMSQHERGGGWDFLPPTLMKAATEGERVLAETGDPQRSDALMDQYMFQEMRVIAAGTRCPYLVRYVETVIDAANLHSVIRTLRMGRSAAFLKEFLFEGGSVGVDSVMRAAANIEVEA